jgi:hypothetical protein
MDVALSAPDILTGQAIKVCRWAAQTQGAGLPTAVASGVGADSSWRVTLFAVTSTPIHSRPTIESCAATAFARMSD